MILIKKWLKYFFLAIAGILLLILFFIISFAIWYYSIVRVEPGKLTTSIQPTGYGRWVNPFIGTGGVPWVCANNFPGAAMPFGMVRLCPETTSILFGKKALNTSGYYYGDNKIIGFSHSRLSGTGAVDGGQFLVTPLSSPPSASDLTNGVSVHFSHANEVAFPGYYAVNLDDSGILAELTATQRTGVHRYTFRSESRPTLLIDVTHALGKGKSHQGEVTILPQSCEITGHVKTFGTFSSRYGGLDVYFTAHFNQPFAGFAIFRNGKTTYAQTHETGEKIGTLIQFAQQKTPLTVEMTLGLSYVSIDNARENRIHETGNAGFAQIAERAKAAWEDRLSAIDITGATDRQRRIFYTALYRTFLMPTRFQDVNGEYKGFDGAVHVADGFQYYTDLSLWDTFRTVHPLYNLLAPKDQHDMVVSLLHMAHQGGWLPRWPSGSGYTNSMLGTPADIMISETWLKGIRNFDIESAYAAMLKTALAPTPPHSVFSGREGVEHYLKFGYCPSELMDEAVSRTVEFGWADYSLSLLADSLGRCRDAAVFRKHAGFYRNLWNPETHYLQPRNSNGRFFEPFKPLLLTYMDFDGKYTNDYVEGTALHWRYSVFYDPQGLISLFPSRENFVNELNNFFAKSGQRLGYWKPDAYYWHGNQPCLHSAYLFNAAGRPDLTQKWVRWVLNTKYDDSPVGLDGNDDAGTLSAWYVFSALGLYPVAGTDRYELAAPLFNKACIRLGERMFEVEAVNNSLKNCYARRIFLNEQKLDRTWLRHAEIERGGFLRFEMSEKP